MGWNHARVCSSLGSLVGVCDQSEEAAARASMNTRSHLLFFRLCNQGV